MSGGQRSDIQGLRALAVIVVVLNHLGGVPSGGFIGVDVFFVISGFLITSLLLREHARTGSISFSRFYRRRIKRIMPAAILVLAVTVGGVCALYSPARAVQTLWDALFAAVSMANWRFAAIGTDYFQAATSPSPLQHFWSLAVEEQFYLAWPWLMLAIFLIMRRRRGSAAGAHRIAGLAMLIISLLSLGWGFYETAANPSSAYFSTFSRAWELGAGALLAVFADRLALIPAKLRPFLAWCGLAGIVVSLLVITSAKSFPLPWALLPVASTALVIAAGTGAPARYLWPLTNPGSRYVGDISYSIYLWHWPLIGFCKSLLPVSGVTRVAVTLAVTAVLATASYHLFEDPIRRSRWLETGQRNAGRTARWSMLGAGALVVLVGSAGLAGQVSAAGAAARSGSSNPIAIPATQPGLSALLKQSLDARQWPELDSTTDLQKLYSPALAPTCFNNWDLTDVDRCTTRPAGASKLAVVVGDSVAMSWVPGIDAALTPAGFAVHALGFSNCPIVLANIVFDAYTAKCSAQHSAILRAVVAMKPDLIIVSDSVYGIGRIAGGPSSTTADEHWTAARAAALTELKRDGARVVLLETNPDGTPLADCRTNLTGPSSCTRPVSPAWLHEFSADSRAAKLAGVEIVDPRPWFCVDDVCPAVVGSTPVRWDAIHLTRQYSTALGPLLREALIPGAGGARK